MSASRECEHCGLEFPEGDAFFAHLMGHVAEAAKVLESWDADDPPSEQTAGRATGSGPQPRQAPEQELVDFKVYEGQTVRLTTEALYFAGHDIAAVVRPDKFVEQLPWDEVSDVGYATYDDPNAIVQFWKKIHYVIVRARGGGHSIDIPCKNERQAEELMEMIYRVRAKHSGGG